MSIENYKKHFEGKKITVMGLGLLGRGVGDAEFLAECGAELIVTDLKTEDELKESVERLKDFENVTFVLGEHRKEDFENRDFILKAAGVPLDSEYIAHAREKGVSIEMSASLFAKVSGIPIIGVTGTRGKTTVTEMIHHILAVATEGSSVLLGGNIRGVSTLQLLKEVEEDSLAVFELDSWQLQGFGEAQISPQIAVFTNFMDDHLTYYNNDRDAYFADKANIFLNQEGSDVLITTPEVFDHAKLFATGKKITLGQEVVLADASVLPEDCLLAMPGEHNRLNAALAYEALKATSLPEEVIFEGLASFPGVPGRLEFLRDIDGIKIYNDNNASTPEATVEGLKSVADGKNVILIIGGTDKSANLGKLPETISQYCAHVILYSGTGTEILKEALDESISQEEHSTLKDCVESAIATTTRGDVILFSPAFSSFGKEYKNYYDRNDQFVQLISEYES